MSLETQLEAVRAAMIDGKPPVETPDFNEASSNFSSIASVYALDLVSPSYLLAKHHRRMSAVEIECQFENIRDAMVELNSAFAALERAHAARTRGETASRLMAAAE